VIDGDAYPNIVRCWPSDFPMVAPSHRVDLTYYVDAGQFCDGVPVVATHYLHVWAEEVGPTAQEQYKAFVIRDGEWIVDGGQIRPTRVEACAPYAIVFHGLCHRLRNSPSWNPDVLRKELEAAIAAETPQSEAFATE